MFLKLFPKNLSNSNNNKNLNPFILNLKKNKVRSFIYTYKKENLFLNFFTRKMYLKGYNYRIKYLRKNKIFRLNLGFPLPLYVKTPSVIRIKKIRKKFYCFYSFDWNTLYKFCWFLRSLRTHFPYKRRGFILSKENPRRKVGKRSRR